MSDSEIRPALTRYSISEAGSERGGWYGIEVENEWGEFVRHEDVQRLFSREDVDFLSAEAWLFLDEGVINARRRQMLDIANRIAALLPPEEK